MKANIRVIDHEPKSLVDAGRTFKYLNWVTLKPAQRS